MDTTELARLKQIEDEYSRMRRIIANQTLEIDAMKNVISKNGWGLNVNAGPKVTHNHPESPVEL